MPTDFQRHKLRRTRDLLLPRLLSGQVALETGSGGAKNSAGSLPKSPSVGYGVRKNRR